MADPLSIIGTAGAIANIIDVLTKTITTVCDMRQAWKIADLSVFAFENQLNLLKFALFEIQKWTESRSNEQSHQLAMQVDGCVTCCRLLIGKIDGEVSQFQKNVAGDLELASKLSFLFKTKDMEQIQRMVDQQTHTLTLLLSACNSNALEEQTRILQQHKLVQALQDMDRDTASLIVHRDSDSIITATSVSSSRWSVQFAFDRELFISKVYDKWIRKLATTRRVNIHSTEDPAQRDHQQISNNEIAVMDPPNDHEQNIAARESVSISKRTPPSRSYSGEWFSPSGRVYMTTSLEIQLLRCIRNMEKLDPEAKEPRRSGWTSKRLLSRSNEVRAVILGSKSRKRVFEETRLSDDRRECYTVDQLRLFRPIILGTVLESVRYLAKRLLSDEDIREDPIRTTLECILIPDKGEDLNLDYGFESSLVERIGTIMKHPTTKKLMVDERLMFPENGEYFLKQVERILQNNYFPTDSDAVNCTTPLPGCVEAAFDLDRSTILLTDPGNTEFSWTKPFDRTKPFDTAVIYVLDLSSPCDEALLDYESTVKLQRQRLRTSNWIVIVNNFKEFMKRLSEASLRGVEFSEYTGGNDAEKAAKYFASKIKNLSPGGIHLHVRFTRGVYEERNLRKIWAMLQEVINNNKLYLVGIM